LLRLAGLRFPARLLRLSPPLWLQPPLRRDNADAVPLLRLPRIRSTDKEEEVGILVRVGGEAEEGETWGW